MSRKRKNNQDVWKQFEKRCAEKRTANTPNNEKSQSVPEDIMVQRMSENPCGRLKKFEPLEPREFVPFSTFQSLTLENVKVACERHYCMSEGTCDVLASNQGPSCTRFDQIKGKKIYLIRFIQPEQNADSSQPIRQLFDPSHPTYNPKENPAPLPTTSKFAKSVSLADLLKAGRIIKKKAPEILHLETFNISTMQWKDYTDMKVIIENDHFDEGAFRKAFKAVEVETERQWVVKKYKTKTVDGFSHLNMSREEHARKQVQMHTVARNLAQRLDKIAPDDFGHTFKYGKVFYADFNGEPITVEEYVEGNFTKYINNDGECGTANEEEIEIYQKAQTLTHFSYFTTEKKMMLLDIQGSAYHLYDPEIATNDLLDNDGEIFFCSGNLSCDAISMFERQHKCSQFCALLNLPVLEIRDKNDE